jgi:hypothetical protein
MTLTNSGPVFSVKKTSDRVTDPYPIPPRIRAMQARDWVDGAVQIARRERLDGTLHFVGQMQGDLIFRCFDSATSRVEHSLILNFEQKRIHCTCWDHAHEYPCAHFGALVLQWREMLQSSLPKNINHPTTYGFWSEIAS